ncbi:RICIN domain-containing protein [Rhodoferax sp.]|uniref:RICIN domain-containing protein n=1 Tax=Rhodoferax sp. TaxID=50421 RepID=UPI00283F1BD7|nr:RICIN domain-containing protein [Rhodoferax sp.]MDR3371221.1 RICIN domain-containing protein [Rhodoferax sp.]
MTPISMARGVLAAIIFTTLALIGNSASAERVNIVAFHSDKCLQPEGIPADGVRVVQATCTGADNQVWEANTFNGRMSFTINDNKGGPNLFLLDGRNLTNSDPSQRIAVLGKQAIEYLPQEWNPLAKGKINGRDAYFFSVDVAISNSGTNASGCLDLEQGNLADGAVVLLKDCSAGYNQYQEFALVPAAPLKFPSNEPIACSVFDDGYSSPVGPSGAIFISGRKVNQEQGKACVPGGQYGQCRKWFGRCFTKQSGKPVYFKVFNDGLSSPTGLFDAIYVSKSGGKACIPDGTVAGTCRKWFGEGQTEDGRHVTCKVFDDGTSNAAGPSRAIYIPAPIPGGGTACIPDGTGRGACRRWFGQCTTD